MEIRSGVNLTPKVKVMGQRSNFPHCPVEMKFDMGDPYGILSMFKIFSRSFKVIKGSLWSHFRFDKTCSNWTEIWCEWSLQQSKHLKLFYRSPKFIRGRYKVTKVKKVKISKNFKWQLHCQHVHLGQTIEIISGAMVNLTPKVKVYGSKVQFSTRSYEDEIWQGWSLRYSKCVQNTFEVIQGHRGGHYGVTSGLIQNTPIDLKFHMNDLLANLIISKYLRGHSRSLRGHF